MSLEAVLEEVSDLHFELEEHLREFPKLVRAEKLDKSSLVSKFIFDSIVLALVIGAIGSTPLDSPFLQDCDSIAGALATECSDLNNYRIISLSGSLIFLSSTITGIVEFIWVSKHALINDGKVLFTDATDEVLGMMFQSMAFSNTKFDAFVFRLPSVLLNLVLFWFSPLFWFQSPSTFRQQFIHYMISVPAMLLPPALVLLLYLLVRDSSNRFECFSYAAALQVYAVMSHLLVYEVFKREAAMGELIAPFTKPTDDLLLLLDELSPIISRAEASGTEVTVHCSQDPTGYSEVQFLHVLTCLVPHYPALRGIRFIGYRCADLYSFKGLQALIWALPIRSLSFDRHDLFSKSQIEMLRGMKAHIKYYSPNE